MTETIVVNGKVYSKIASNDEILDPKTFVKINSFITETIKKNGLECLKTENIIRDSNIVFQILSPDSIANTHFFTLSSILNREYKTYHLETFIDNHYTSDLSSETDELSEDDWNRILSSIKQELLFIFDRNRSINKKVNITINEIKLFVEEVAKELNTTYEDVVKRFDKCQMLKLY